MVGAQGKALLSTVSAAAQADFPVPLLPMALLGQPIIQGYFEQADNGHGMFPTPGRAQAGTAVSEGDSQYQLTIQQKEIWPEENKTRASETEGAQGQCRVSHQTHRAAVPPKPPTPRA